MNAVTYNSYQMLYSGVVVPIDSWQPVERDARGIIERYQRIYTVNEPDSDSMIMAVCAVAECIYRHAQEDQTAGMASASIGSVHVSYSQPSSPAERRKLRSREIWEAATTFLDIYRG